MSCAEVKIQDSITTEWQKDFVNHKPCLLQDPKAYSESTIRCRCGDH